MSRRNGLNTAGERLVGPSWTVLAVGRKLMHLRSCKLHAQ